jgi:hypothetical protein
MKKNYSEVRKPDRHSQSRHIRSEVRGNPSRSRSRDDAKSRYSNASGRSNKTGPVIFGGNTTIKKSEKVDESCS